MHHCNHEGFDVEGSHRRPNYLKYTTGLDIEVATCWFGLRLAVIPFRGAWCYLSRLLGGGQVESFGVGEGCYVGVHFFQGRRGIFRAWGGCDCQGGRPGERLGVLASPPGCKSSPQATGGRSPLCPWNDRPATILPSFRDENGFPDLSVSILSCANRALSDQPAGLKDGSRWSFICAERPPEWGGGNESHPGGMPENRDGNRSKACMLPAAMRSLNRPLTVVIWSFNAFN